MKSILKKILPPRLAEALKTVFKRSVKQMVAGQGRGLKFDSGPSNPAYQSGHNELPVQNALAHYTKKGDVFYDIGANVGFFTVIGARLVGSKGSVFAFEPLQANIKYIKKNIAVNKFQNVKVIEKAVSNYSGWGKLNVAAFSGGSALSTAAVPPDFVETIDVEMVMIDDLVLHHEMPPPSIIKIDVEGAELEVLAGMKKTISTCFPVVIYEVDDGDKGRLQQKIKECKAFFKKFKYRIISLEDSYTGSSWHVSHFAAIP